MLELAFDDTFVKTSFGALSQSLFKNSTCSRVPKESCYWCVL